MRERCYLRCLAILEEVRACFVRFPFFRRTHFTLQVYLENYSGKRVTPACLLVHISKEDFGGGSDQDEGDKASK